MDPFSDPQAVAWYAERPPRLVPGFDSLQRMAEVLLAERAPNDARVLVLGAGGGLKLRAFAQARPGWIFDGIDPSAEMLRLAERTLGPLAAATCLLTLHFVDPEARRPTLAAVRRRLKPGAPFVVAHLSVPQGPGERARWLSRYAAFAVASDVAPEHAATAQATMDAQLTILTPEQDEALLREAGFADVTSFYIGLAFRGWVAYA